MQSKAYKLQVKVEPRNFKASCLNIDLEKQTDGKGCLVFISSDYFLSYELQSARGKSFLQNSVRMLCFRKQREECERANSPKFSVHTN